MDVSKERARKIGRVIRRQKKIFFHDRSKENQSKIVGEVGEAEEEEEERINSKLAEQSSVM